MGLSGRKVKQRIPQDPRNLSWADDASRFGSAYLAKLGFDHRDKNATLGISGVGLAKNLKVHHKLDMLGIGAQHTKDPSGIAWKQNRDFENLLKRLNANSDSAEGGSNSTPIDGFQPAHVHEPVVNPVNIGSETEGRDEDEGMKREKSKKKKRPWNDDETAGTENSPRKRKQVEPTTFATASDPMERGPFSSFSPVLETNPFVIGDHARGDNLSPPGSDISKKTHCHGRAHRARFIASKRLAATSSRAVAEILGIPSSSVTPLSSPGATTPDVTPLVETSDHGHLTVSTKTVAEYFKEKIGLVASKRKSSETITGEAPRCGIGSRLEACNGDPIKEDEGCNGGLGMSLLAKMSTVGAVEGIVPQEIPRRKGKKREGKGRKKRRSGDDEDELNRERRD